MTNNDKALAEMPEGRNHGDLIRWLDKHETTIRHALSEMQRMKTEGLVMVPKAPSEPMIDAALEYTDGYNYKYFLGLYRAMIAAAPPVTAPIEKVDGLAEALADHDCASDAILGKNIDILAKAARLQLQRQGD